MIALFCGVVNCPVASVFLSVGELFGSAGYFIVCARLRGKVICFRDTAGYIWKSAFCLFKI